MFKAKWFIAGYALSVAGVLALAQPANAQQYPTKPVKLVVGFLAGSGVDRVARSLAAQLSAQLGQLVGVENIPGAGGSTATGYVASAAPDGYTLLVANDAQMAINPSYYGDKSKLAPIARVVSTPLVGVVPADSSAADIKAFLDLAKKNPAAYHYGSPGPGTINHLGVELLKSKTGTKFVHTPRWWGTPLAEGQFLVDGNTFGLHGVQFLMTHAAAVEKFVKDGKLRALVAFSDKRVPSLSNVPTSAEAGLPRDMTVSSWIGLAAPDGTPAQIVERLQREVETALAAPKLLDGLSALGAEPAFLSATGFRALIASEQRRWSDVMRVTGTKRIVRPKGLGADRIPAVATPTKEFEIRNNRAYLGGHEFKLWGIRTANALRSTVITERHIRNLDNLAAHGINALLVYIDGGNTGFPNPWRAHLGFGPDGTLDPVIADRLEWLAREADKRGMVIGVGFYTSRTTSLLNKPMEEKYEITEAVAKRAIQEASKFLVERKLRNVVIDAYHEFGNPRGTAPTFSEPDGPAKKAKVVSWIHEVSPKLKAGICGASNETGRDFPGMEFAWIEKSTQIHPELYTLSCETNRPDGYDRDGIFTEEQVEEIYANLELFHAAPNAGVFISFAYIQGLSNGGGGAPHAELGGYGYEDDPGIRFVYEWIRDNVGRWQYPRHVKVKK